MEQSQIYGQMDFNLPHDVISLPSKGVFYKPRKESLKVGYLTALDENMLMSPNVFKDGLVYNLLKSKIYEPGFDVNQLYELFRQRTTTPTNSGFLLFGVWSRLVDRNCHFEAF